MTKRRDPLPLGLRVQATQCATCIYRPDSTLNLKELERQIADTHMPGHFKGARLCHHARNIDKVTCRGFWNRHKDHFDAGQLAQRLKLVVFVAVDRFAKTPRRDTAIVKRGPHQP